MYDSMFGTSTVPEQTPDTAERIPQTAVPSADSTQNDIGNTETRDASGRGAVIGGNATARTSMGGAGGGSAGGGGGGGAGGYSLGASLADSNTMSLGFSGETGAQTNRGSFGDFTTAFGGGNATSGLNGLQIAGLVLGLLTLAGAAYFLARR